MDEIIELIWKIAENIREDLNFKRTKRILRELIKEIGGEVIETDNLIELYERTVEKTSKNHFKIFVYNGFRTIENENFIIAKEIGHLILHIGFGTEKWESIPKGKIILKNVDYDTIETEKEEFALAFLMPKKEYRDFLYKNKKNNTIDIKIIAKYFKVSKQNALIRGKKLGYIE